MAKAERYVAELGLSEYDAGVLLADPEWAAFYEAALAEGADAKLLCNWLTGDTARLLNESGKTLSESLVTSAHLADLVRLVEAGEVSSKVAKEALTAAFETGSMPSAVVRERGLSQISDDSFIIDAVKQVLAAHPGPATQFREGKEQAIGFLVGQVMKATQGRANPAKVQEEMRRQLA
jgi:aspartyl-tRNA(Asn)/glutamyl-tRNA(Gln) amidotransferase subunit B